MMHRFRLYGGGQLTAAGEQAQVLARRWSAEWLPAGAACTAHLLAVDATAAAPGRWLAALNGDAACFVRREAMDIEVALFGPAARQQPSVLAAEVGDAAVADLARRFAGAPADAPVSEDAPPAALALPGSGALRLQLGLADATLELRLHAAAVARLLGAYRAAPRAPARTLHSLRAAVGSARMQVEASIGEAEIDVATLHSLAPGDVLPLNLRIDRPLPLTLAGVGVQRGGYLGIVDGRRALRMTATPSSPGPAALEQKP